MLQFLPNAGMDDADARGGDVSSVQRVGLREHGTAVLFGVFPGALEYDAIDLLFALGGTKEVAVLLVNAAARLRWVPAFDGADVLGRHRGAQGRRRRHLARQAYE